MSNTVYPTHPPMWSIGGGAVLTEAAVRQYENLLEVLWENIQNKPDWEGLEFPSWDDVTDKPDVVVKSELPYEDIRDYGALCNGVANDSPAIALAVAAAIISGKPVLLPGYIRINQSIADGGYRVRFLCCGEGNAGPGTKLLWGGPDYDPAFELTGHRSSIEGGFAVHPLDVANRYKFTGVRCSGVASRCYVQLPVIYQGYIGIECDTVYGCIFLGAETGSCLYRGINLINESNSNSFIALKNVNGTSPYTSGARGISVSGSWNYFSGNQLSEWNYNYYGVDGVGNEVHGLFSEASPVACKLDEYAEVIWDTNGSSGRLEIHERAIFRTSRGNISAGIQHVPVTMMPTPTTYHPFLGPVVPHKLADMSGTGKRTVGGQGTWTDCVGPLSGYGALLAGGAYNSIRLDPTAIDKDLPWTVAILVRSRSWGTSDENKMLSVIDGASGQLSITLQKNTGQFPIRRNGSHVINAPSQKYDTDDWIWVVQAYDPAAAKWYNLQPEVFGSSLGRETACVSPFGSAIAYIEIGSNGAGTTEYGDIAVFKGEVLTPSQVSAWVNRTSVLPIPAAVRVNALPITIPDGNTSPSLVGSNLFICSNTALTTMSVFSGGVEGGAPKTLLLDANTRILPTANIKLKNGIAFRGAAGDTLTLQYIGGVWYEIARKVSREARFYVKDYGALGDNSTNDTAAIQACIDAAGAYGTIVFDRGFYRAAGLTGTSNGQRFVAEGGYVLIYKNGNGALFTHSGNDVTIEHLGFRGVSASYTGHNIVLSGNNPTLLLCGSRDAAGRAVLATGNHVQIVGTNDIYQTADATGTGFDIEVGVSGTATLYHQIMNIYSSQATGGIKFIDCGSQSVLGGQFGKLSIVAGTSPAGVNGGMCSGARVLGVVTVDVSNASFTSNQFAEDITIGVGTSGVCFDFSNVYTSGKIITNNGNDNNVIVKQISAGSTQRWQVGDNTSAAWIDFLPSGNGLITVSEFAVPNNRAVYLGDAAGTGFAGSMLATTSDNVQVKSSIAGKGLQLIATATGVVQIVLGSTVIAVADASGLHIGAATTDPILTSCTGTPEGAVTAPVGSVCMRKDGGAVTSVYFKETGSGNTGWVAK